MYALHSPVSFDSYDAFRLSMVLLSLHLSWLGSSHTQTCTSCASLILLFVFVRVRGTIVVPIIEPLTEIPSIDYASFICLRYTLSSHSPHIVSFANTHTTHLLKPVSSFITLYLVLLSNVYTTPVYEACPFLTTINYSN